MTVVNAINAASTGQTVCVAAGSAMWSSRIMVSKGITIAGAAAWGGGTTTITANQAFYFSCLNNDPIALRVTGFTIAHDAAPAPTFQVDGDAIGFPCRGWRIDHIIRTNNSGSIIEFMDGWGYDGPAGLVEGLIDNNTIYDGRILHAGQRVDDGGGNARYNEPDFFGTEKAIYIEDNLFIVSSPSGTGYVNQTDGNQGSRTVARFNSFENGRIESHSLQGSRVRAPRIWEFYYNRFRNTLRSDRQARPFFIRGGPGFAFGNDHDSVQLFGSMDLDNARSHDRGVVNQMGSMGGCNGSSFIDGNQSEERGYLCRDQLGAGRDASLWDFSNPAPAQQRPGAYFWANTLPGPARWDPQVVCGSVPPDLFQSCDVQADHHLVWDRSIFRQGNTFDGTSGVGVGILAKRPAACTVGVAYWATDQGGWNHSTANTHGVQVNGADGVLYKCTAANTWTTHYTPLTYPHPRRGGVR